MLNGIENKYEITKNVITDIETYLSGKKLYTLIFNNSDNISNLSSDRKSKEFTKINKANITHINEFDIIKLNQNGQYFSFKVITIVSNHKVEWFIENKLFYTKVKMRMFNTQQFKKVS